MFKYCKIFLTGEGDVVQLFECLKTAADVALTVEDAVHVRDGLALQGEDITDPVRKCDLVTHDLCHVLQQFIKCTKLFIVDGNHCSFEKFVSIDIKFDFLCSLVSRNLYY